MSESGESPRYIINRLTAGIEIDLPNPDFAWFTSQEQLPEEARKQIPEDIKEIMHILELRHERSDPLRAAIKKRAKRMNIFCKRIYGNPGNYIIFHLGNNQSPKDYGDRINRLINKVNKAQPEGSLRLTYPQEQSR